MMHDRCGQDKVQSYQTVLILTSKCDLDICGTGLSLVRDTPPQHGECLCQVMWESYDAWLRCEPDKVQSYQTTRQNLKNLSKWKCNPFPHLDAF